MKLHKTVYSKLKNQKVIPLVWDLCDILLPKFARLTCQAPASAEEAVSLSPASTLKNGTWLHKNNV